MSTFTNNASTIAHLESRVKVAQTYAAEMTSESAGFIKEANHFQALLDIEVAKREELIKTVSREEIQSYINEKQKVAKKFKSHAELINAHLSFYINKIGA